MAKKSFKNNPALQFISAADEQEVEQTIVEPKQKAMQIANGANRKIAQKTMQTVVESQGAIQIGVPEDHKINPLYVEKKSRRLQLVLQPSLFERVRAKATAMGLSVNEYIHQLLDEATREG